MRTAAFAVGLLLFGCEADPGPGSAPQAETPRPEAAFRLQVISPALGSTPSWGAAWSDVDGDGYPDLLLGRHKSDAWLLMNRRGRFERATEEALGKPVDGKTYYDRHNCAWGESNGDGAPDAYCVSGAQSGTGTGPNQLLEASDGRLEDMTPGILVDERSRGRSVNWLDYDSDGDLDIFVGNEYLDGSPNAIFTRVNSGYVSKPVGVETTMATVSSSWADWDLDGDPDLVALGHGHQPSHVYENIGGVFREVVRRPFTGREWTSLAWADFDHDEDLDALLTGTRNAVVAANEDGRFRVVHRFSLQAGRQAVWLDVENDTDADIFVVQGRPGAPPSDDPAFSEARDAPDLLILNEDGELRVAERFRSAGAGANGEAIAVSDFDRDGRPDLVITNGYLRDRGRVLLARNTTDSANWAAVELIGSNENPHAYGAMLRIGGPSPWIVPVTDGVIWHSQSETGHLVVGLADAKELPIEVLWPDGSKDCGMLRHAATLEISAGDSPC